MTDGIQKSGEGYVYKRTQPSRLFCYTVRINKIIYSTNLISYSVINAKRVQIRVTGGQIPSEVYI
jgi:hypothetical protein